MDLKCKIGIAIHKRRTEIGMSQEELGLLIGLDQGYVSRIEKGKMNLTLDTIEAICKALDCEVGELF